MGTTLRRITARAAARIAVLVMLMGVPPLSAQPSGGVRVHVTDSEGRPVTDADVRVLSLGRTAHVTAEGTASFDAVPEGDYLVEAVSPRAGRGVAQARVQRGTTVEVVITVSRFFHGQEIVVSAGREALQADLYTASSVKRGIDLRAAAAPTLGETLADEPGVTSTYFGPGASRPLIRGLGGDRVRLLESGVGSGDASDTSPDHAPSIEPAQAERIEVIRGPATLLYGSAAIGGVVNVEDGRVPREGTPHPLTGSLLLRGGTVANERNASGILNGSTGRFAYHLGGLWRKTDDYAIPGFASVNAVADGVPESERGSLFNSAIEQTRFAGGLSYVGETGFLGASYSGYDSDYGVPVQEEEGNVSIDMKQRRVDAESGWRFGNRFLKGVKARFGLADYRHFEVLTDPDTGDRAIDTQFYNNEWEGRLELQHAIGGSVNGAVGGQISSRDFKAVGEEAFVPPTETDQLAFFLYEQVDLGSAVSVQGGARVEHQKTTNVPDAIDRTDEGVSASLGLAFSLSDQISLALSGSRSVKLPNAEELFANGPHVATDAFEIGDPDLGQEVGYGAEASLRLLADRVHGELTFFVNSFDGFIDESLTGEVEDGLEVVRFTQADALFTGFEGRVEVELYHAADTHVAADVWGDYVRARLRTDDSPLPRIPPLRFGGGLGYTGAALNAHVGVSRTTEQDRVAAFEDPTAGYTLLDARVGYRLFQGRFVHDIVLSGSNLTDEEARSHTSFLKDLVPLPGREVRLTYQISF